LTSGPQFSANIHRAATAHGVDPERVVLAPIVKHESHLARLVLGDLFLDSLPYNAHTTASEALWMGLPLLTCRGSTFPGRVAASLLTALGLPELITENGEDYQARAVALAGDPVEMARLREKLAAARTASPLFDTALYTRRLEAEFTRMVERWENGEMAGGLTSVTA
jgi:protein O-GlcNAc transferase